MNSNREPDQGELVEDSMFILPDNHAQQQNENENANYPRNIANQVVDNLR